MIREPSLFILTALVASPLHGYAIIQRVESLSEGRIRLRAGTLYAALDRLVREGSLVTDGEETVDGRRRRRYRLTPEGRRELLGEADRMAANAALAHDALALGGFVLYALAGAVACDRVARAPRALAVARRCIGVLLLGFAARLALAER